ncbi:hypothetical protein EVAR_43544_1 [Eumeta japonica]|uniref:Uncharacterized protein n=1 Tax=Eumeta variegata TaxID=151549 RepID=A0A4C1W9Y1_EUMVA|nr:hypothetical protein EVAR_43544_1 [Eumeta japonica]
MEGRWGDGGGSGAPELSLTKRNSTAEAFTSRQTPVFAQPARGVPGLDVRYAATYGNPYLKSSTLGLGGQVHTAKPTQTPAPPPYSAVRNSVSIPPDYKRGRNRVSDRAAHCGAVPTRQLL